MKFIDVLVVVAFVVGVLVGFSLGEDIGKKSILNDCAKNGVVVIDDGALRCMPIIYEGRING